MTRCPRCNGRLFKDDGEMACLACGHREELPAMETNGARLDVREAIAKAIEYANRELREAEAKIQPLRDEIKRLEKAQQALTGKKAAAAGASGWTPERRAAQAETMRLRRSAEHVG